MPIRPSSAADVGRLIDELSSADALQRETAAARLAVIGSRAVTRLSSLALDESAADTARLAALQALEAIADPRTIAAALSAAAEPGAIGLAAIALVGAIARTRDARATRAFEWLAALALDRDAGESRRLAALTALEAGSLRHLGPIYQALAADPNARLAARATRRAAGQTMPLDRAIDKGLPDEPEVVAAMIRDDADETNVTTLRRLLEQLRQRQREARDESQSAVWMAARGQVHQSLAARGSRLGLYDLRETLEGSTAPLPVGFLSAAAAIGDAACLEPLAAAWVAASSNQRWWREHVAEAFRAIVRREKLTRRHPTLKKILERRPAAGVLVAEARK